MRDFSLAGFIAHIAAADARMSSGTRGTLDRAAKVVEAEAKAEIGHYQGAVGPFAAWAPLAQATQEDRVAQGYPANEPLLREGTLRDSIKHSVDVQGPGHGVAVIGSDSPVAVYQELGTRSIPPRSFLGGAAMRKAPEVKKIVGHGAVMALLGPGSGVKLD